MSNNQKSKKIRVYPKASSSINEAQDFHKEFSEEELFALEELGIDPGLLVFDGRPLFNLPFLKPRRFVCHLQIKDGLYQFDLPKKAPRQFKRSVSKIEKKLLSSNNAHMKKLMKSVKENAEFIERFNFELFFKHSFYKGEKISAEEIVAFYENPTYCKVINLSVQADRQAFIALYAMAFYACTAEDLFTIDGIFSMQPERHADNVKKVSGNAVFNLILRNVQEEIKQVLTQMSQTLLEIQPPRVNLSDTVGLSKNYTLFVGLSEIGRVFFEVASSFSGAFLSEEAIRAAQSLVNYASLVELCDTISTLRNNKDYRETEIFKKCQVLF